MEPGVLWGVGGGVLTLASCRRLPFTIILKEPT